MWRARYLPAASTGCVPIADNHNLEDRTVMVEPVKRLRRFRLRTCRRKLRILARLTKCQIASDAVPCGGHLDQASFNHYKPPTPCTILPLTRRPQCGLQTRKAVVASPASTARLQERPTKKNFRWDAIPYSSIHWAHPMASRSRLCWKSCWRQDTQERSMTPG